MDGLRLDAIHAITDKSARPFLEELSTAAHREADRLGRRVHVIGESDLNDVRVFRPRVAGDPASTASGATTSTTPCTPS